MFRPIGLHPRRLGLGFPQFHCFVYCHRYASSFSWSPKLCALASSGSDPRSATRHGSTTTVSRNAPEEYIASKNRKGRWSWIQAHGFFLTEVSPDLRTLQSYWVCSKCDGHGKSSLFVASNTTSPIEHLRRYVISVRVGHLFFLRLTTSRSHLITRTDDSLGDAEDDSVCAVTYPPSKRRCVQLPIARCNVNKAKELTVGWIVTANLPFTAPSNLYLRRILDLPRCIIGKGGAVESAVGSRYRAETI